MSDNIVRKGQLGSLSTLLTIKLGRRVVVHRSEQRFELPSKLPGKRGSPKSIIRYSIGIEGSMPSVFFNMTVNECKARMAMLADLLMSGVVHASPPVPAQPSADRGSPVPSQQAQERPAELPGPGGYSSLCDQGDDESSGDNDRY